MNQNLKSGDLYIIIGGLSSLNFGKTVTLVQRVLPGQIVRFGDRAFSNNRNAPAWLVTGEGLYVMREYGDVIRNETAGLGLEQHLIKIGNEDNQQTLVKEKDKELELS